MEQDLSEQYLTYSDNVFRQDEKSGKIYIGNQEITESLREVLKSDAEIFLASRLFQVMNASIINEAYDIALKQSKDFDQVRTAKMLHHWNHFLVNMMVALAK